MKAFSEAEIEQAMQDATLWRREGQEIRRIFLLPTFMNAIGFVNQVAAHAESVNHHPDIDIRYNRITLALSTHDANGLTEKDFAFAKVADELFQQC